MPGIVDMYHRLSADVSINHFLDSGHFPLSKVALWTGVYMTFWFWYAGARRHGKTDTQKVWKFSRGVWDHVEQKWKDQPMRAARWR